MQKISSEQKIRVGLVGAGQWARVGHLPVLTSLPQYDLVALATTRRATAEAAAKDFNVADAYDRYEELIDRSDIDLIVVNNRAPEHYPVALAAINAGKHVYCEWPLTTNIQQTSALLDAATLAGVRHVVGLQRRMAASTRYLSELLKSGYIGRLRSVNLHVTEPNFYGERPSSAAFTVPIENFSSVVSIYGGHFLDMLFATVGQPQRFSAHLANQFPQVTFTDTNEKVPCAAPDQLILGGTLVEGVLSAHVEGGKRNGYGVRLEITGTEGDLLLVYDEAFSDQFDGRILGAQGSRQTLVEMPVPERLNWSPAKAGMGGSVLELSHLYTAFAHDLVEGTTNTPTFADALRLHRLIKAMEDSSQSGTTIDWHGLKANSSTAGSGGDDCTTAVVR